MLESIQITKITREVFNKMLQKETSHYYDNFELVSRWVLGLWVKGMPK